MNNQQLYISPLKISEDSHQNQSFDREESIVEFHYLDKEKSSNDNNQKDFEIQIDNPINNTNDWIYPLVALFLNGCTSICSSTVVTTE